MNHYTEADFVSHVRKHMRTMPNDWLIECCTVDNHAVKLRLYGKSIAELDIDGLAYGGLWDMSTQKEVLRYLTESLHHAE